MFKKTGIVSLLVASFAVSAFAQEVSPVILVDKKTNQIHVGNYKTDQIEVVKTFHTTLGKTRGDKEVEKDLKTPEGIYLFTAKLRPPQIKKKFGKMAIMMNYPNPIDLIAGKTGFDIMLHATDEPARLSKDLDSEGCVVVSDEQIEEISQHIRLGITPIIIYDELKPEFLKADSKPELRQAFQKWLTAWNGKDIDAYIGSYSDKFVYNGMNLRKYREYKDSLNKKYSKIQVEAENIRYFFHPKYDVVAFIQNYQSELRGGGKGFKSVGTKFLYFVKDAGGAFKVANESYTNLR
ncbi:MAG: L,D-transpeptidase family protein [Bdellovibrionota bacterium]